MDDRDRLHPTAPWVPWAITSVALVLVAVIAYSFGVQREVVTAAGEPVRRGWYIGGFPGFWLGFFLFWVLFGGLRRMWWGYSGYYGCRPWRYGRYYPPYDPKREDWEEWHRRAHDRMDGGRARDAASPPPADRKPIT